MHGGQRDSSCPIDKSLQRFLNHRPRQLRLPEPATGHTPSKSGSGAEPGTPCPSEALVSLRNSQYSFYCLLQTVTAKDPTAGPLGASRLHRIAGEYRARYYAMVRGPVKDLLTAATAEANAHIFLMGKGPG